MATPIIEYIAANIAATVNQVTIANGFNQDLVAVRPRRNDFSDIVPEDGKVLIVQADDEDTDSQFTGTKQWLQPFILMALVIDSDKAITSIDTRLNQVKSDLRKKFCEDRHRGGYAIDTICRPSVGFDDGEGFTGIAVGIDISYRTNEDNPYAQA